MLNKCMFIGHVGRDPEIRTTQDGREIANFSLGVSESWKDKATGERKSKTEWVRFSVFNENLVRLLKSYIKKGSKIYAEGQLQTRKWTDKDGAEKYSTEVVLQNFGGTIVMLDSKGDVEPKEPQNPATKAFVASQGDLDDEIPF